MHAFGAAIDLNASVGKYWRWSGLSDDVRASHGAATGQLEKNELFYLRSRGLDEKQARFIF